MRSKHARYLSHLLSKLNPGRNPHNTRYVGGVLLQAIDSQGNNTGNTHNTQKQISLR